ncbi:metal-dependent transcriptional regulator [Naasia lichenicola]|uniref:metal-dependent transcriptional regulator n=1 Tax=Naasia lichenicola TaxID=2565933 RepID=UPI0018EEC64A|nr:metal-dependent transcriptional regulator [Naasia lichenicola]
MSKALSATVVEDYLKAIYSHTEWQDQPITSSQLSARLSLAPSTVTEMVKKLVGHGLVLHEPYGAVVLTDAGRNQAIGIVRRHRLIESWLVGQYGYSWDEVHDEAEVLEHVMSDRLLDAIDAQLGHPTHDPHGDPIPALDGVIRMPDAVLLEAQDGAREGRIVRISDRDPEVLRELEARRLSIGSEVTADSLPAWLHPSIWISTS